MFDQRDVDKFNSSQLYIDRFFKHVDSVASNVDEQVDLAMTMVINTFKFRKEMGMAGEELVCFSMKGHNDVPCSKMRLTMYGPPL